MKDEFNFAIQDCCSKCDAPESTLPHATKVYRKTILSSASFPLNCRVEIWATVA